MPGLDEKRGTQRQPILKAGTISFHGSGIDCLVRNMSDEGANLEVESQIGIPNSFDLARACRHLSQVSAQTRCSPARKLRAVFS